MNSECISVGEEHPKVEETSRAQAWSQEGAWHNEGATLAGAKESVREQPNTELEK